MAGHDDFRLQFIGPRHCRVKVVDFKPEKHSVSVGLALRITDPFIALITPLTPKATAPVVVWLFGVVWLFWLRVGLLYVFLLLGALPRSG